jgi:hypothetical protein
MCLDEYGNNHKFRYIKYKIPFMYEMKAVVMLHSLRVTVGLWEHRTRACACVCVHVQLYACECSNLYVSVLLSTLEPADQLLQTRYECYFTGSQT